MPDGFVAEATNDEPLADLQDLDEVEEALAALVERSKNLS